ncbi:MAG TPA: fibronectin type III domain-containing protein, partial [Gemmatimonadaceae bacterium]|nr:fibronectin type III domain-containing protein [Gemmatimonadaceae bacterium]
MAKPSAVADLQASVPGSASVTLSFTQVNDGTGQPAKYDVRYAVAPISWGSATSTTSGTCTTPVVGTAIGAQLSCTVLGLAPSTNYSFQLVAFRGTLNQNAVFGSLSNVASATTTSSTPPPPVPVASVSVTPASATLQIGATLQLQVSAFDGNNNPLTGRVVTSSSADPGIASVSSVGLVTAVSAGTTHITVTSEGKSAVSTITVSAAPPPTGNPGTVADLQASVTGSTAVTLSFTQVNDGTGQPAKYDVRYAVAPISWGSAASTTSGTCTTPVAGTVIGAQLSCTVLGLTPSTNYNFQLVAFRGTLNQNAVFGSLSNIAAAATTGSAPVPVATVTVSPAS